MAFITAFLALVVGRGASAQSAAASLEVVVRGMDHEYTMIGFVVPLPDGGVLVSYPRESLLRHFGPSGAFHGEIGRSGGGPKEFAALGGIGARSDGYWVFDRGNSRFAVLDLNLTIVRTARLAGSLRTPKGQVAPYNLRGAMALLAGDTALFHFQHRSPSPSERWSGLFRVSPDGVVLEELLRVPPDPCFRETTHAGQLASHRVPFCASPLIAVSPSGKHAIAIRHDEASSASRLCIRTWRNGGASVPPERCRPYTPPPVPAAARDSVVSLLRSRAPSPEMARLMTTVAAGRTHHPAFATVIVSDDGWIIRDEPTTSTQVRWFVEDPVGVATVITLPKGVVVRAVGGGWLWAVRADDDGVEDLIRVKMPTR